MELWSVRARALRSSAQICEGGVKLDGGMLTLYLGLGSAAGDSYIFAPFSR